MAWTDGLGKSNSVSSSCRAFGGSSVDGPAFDRCLQRADTCLAERRGADLFQHQIHHRGQAHAMLSGTRIKPPQLDEFFSIAEAPLRTSEFAGLGWTEETVWGPNA